MSEDQGKPVVDGFRLARSAPRMVFLLCGGLMVLMAVALGAGPGFATRGEAVLLAISCSVLALITIATARLWVRRPVQLRVGPDGLDLVLGFAAPLAWARIHRIERPGPTRTIYGVQEWLIVYPRPGEVPDYRLPSPRRLELWHLRRGGLRVPLHGLDADPGTVIASIERFMPVQRAPE